MICGGKLEPQNTPLFLKNGEGLGEGKKLFSHHIIHLRDFVFFCIVNLHCSFRHATLTAVLQYFIL